ncbi:MAG: T9SS type A sorting domain-containing protein [Candidatus Cloacimonadales bacterium]
MIFMILALLLVPMVNYGYEVVWRTDFPSQEGYGIHGDEVNIPTDEWNIDLRGTSLIFNSSQNWFKVKEGVLEGIALKCSEQLQTPGVGALWSSRSIALDPQKNYHVEYYFESEGKWDTPTQGVLNDFIRLGYFNDNGEFILIEERTGNLQRDKVSAIITGTSECRLVVEVDCNARDEIFKLHEVGLYHEFSSSSAPELIITKLCAVRDLGRKNRYIQITNPGNRLINLKGYNLEAVCKNKVIYQWSLQGILAPYESLVCGDKAASQFFTDIGYDNWYLKNVLWEGISTNNNDGAQIVRDSNRAIIDRVVGVKFYEGYTHRVPSFLIASEVTNPEAWTYAACSNAQESNPGVFTFDDTLPVSLYNVSFSFSGANYLLNWVTYEESELLGYNIYYCEEPLLLQAIRINSLTIPAQNSTHLNQYSYSLAELASRGYLWLEILSYNDSPQYSDIIIFTPVQPDNNDSIEVINPLSLTIFPNPISLGSYVRVENSETPISELKLYNLRGQLVRSKKFTNLHNQYNLKDLTQNIGSGIYLLKARIGDKIYTKKLVNLK